MRTPGENHAAGSLRASAVAVRGREPGSGYLLRLDCYTPGHRCRARSFRHLDSALRAFAQGRLRGCEQVLAERESCRLPAGEYDLCSGRVVVVESDVPLMPPGRELRPRHEVVGAHYWLDHAPERPATADDEEHDPLALEIALQLVRELPGLSLAEIVRHARRRRADVLRVLREHPSFTDSGRGRGHRWRIVLGSSLAAAAREARRGAGERNGTEDTPDPTDSPSGQEAAA